MGSGRREIIIAQRNISHRKDQCSRSRSEQSTAKYSFWKSAGQWFRDGIYGSFDVSMADYVELCPTRQQSCEIAGEPGHNRLKAGECSEKYVQCVDHIWNAVE